MLNQQFFTTMLLKKYSYLLLAGVLATFSVACDDEDGTTIRDTEKPTATLTSPTQDQVTAGFMAGTSLTVTGTVSDNRDLETVTLMINAPGETTPWFTETWTEADFSGNTLQINETIDIPANTAEGAHTMTLTALDDAENLFTQTWTLNIMPGENARFNVTVPAGTPEDAKIFVVGTFSPNGWDSDDTNEAFMLTRNEDGTFSGNFMIPEGDQEFKFRIKSDDPNNMWKFEEGTAECQPTQNRTATGTGEMQTLSFTVDNFRNVTCTP